MIFSGSKACQKDENHIAHSSNAQRQNRKTEILGNPILKKSMNTGKESQILLPEVDLKAQRRAKRTFTVFSKTPKGQRRKSIILLYTKSATLRIW